MKGAKKPIKARVSSGPAFQPVEHRPISSLVPYKRNARLHDRQQLDDLKRSMEEFGWTIPVVVDESGGIIAGHARVIAATELGYTEAPVIVAAGWSEAKKKAYILADNKLTERGGWNWELVSAELKDIRDLGADVALSGFEEFELIPLLAGEWGAPGASKDDAKEKPHGSGETCTITVTTEQYENISQAIEQVREAENNPRMSDGRALELLASRITA